MSYHGGLVGVAVGIWWVARQHRVDFVRLMDFLYQQFLQGIFGRLGNFFNQELVGRVTTAPVGMFFQEILFYVTHHNSTRLLRKA